MADSARAYEAIHGAEKATVQKHQITGRHLGKVVDAYDGDTCRVAIAIPTYDTEPLVEFIHVRMLGYDAPEMKKEQLAYGREVKAVFHALVLGKVVVIDIPVPKKPDPYGRTLARMYAVERGAMFQLSPPPSTGCWRGIANRLCCCSSGGTVAIRASDGTSSEPGTTSATVRDKEVYVPVTVDVPAEYSLDDESLSALLDVNQWMIANARVKEYDGKTSRGDWTAEELKNGV